MVFVGTLLGRSASRKFGSQPQIEFIETEVFLIYTIQVGMME